MSRVEKQPYPDQVVKLRRQLLEAAQQPEKKSLIVPRNLAASLFSQPQKEFFQKLDDNKLFLLVKPQGQQAEINLLHRTLNFLPESISDISRLASDSQFRGNQIMRWYQEIYGGLQTQNWDQVSSAYNLSAQSLRILAQHDITRLSESYLEYVDNITDYQPAKKERQNRYPLGYISEGREAHNYLLHLWNILNKNDHQAQIQLLKTQGLTPDNALQTLTTTDQFPNF